VEQQALELVPQPPLVRTRCPSGIGSTSNTNGWTSHPSGRGSTTTVSKQWTLVEVVQDPPPHNQTKGVLLKVVPQPHPFELATQPPQVKAICFTYIPYNDVCHDLYIYTMT
jgi:hypothetical protein